jgi:hypothetical protein
MIRRGFWLAVGAVGGIIGYRRIVALLPRRGDPPGSPRSPLAPRRRWVRETIRFTRDAREGMDLYMARHPPRVGPTLDPDGKDRPRIGRADIDENVKDER